MHAPLLIVCCFCEEHRPDPDQMRGWWIQNHTGIGLCRTCGTSQCDWLYVGTGLVAREPVGGE